MRKLFLISIGLLIVSTSTFAGGLLTNTNQHVLFLRMLARDASTQIDAVYSNPAGVAFMENGFHLSLNGQSAFQTRTITSTLQGLEETLPKYIKEKLRLRSFPVYLQYIRRISGHFRGILR